MPAEAAPVANPGFGGLAQATSKAGKPAPSSPAEAPAPADTGDEKPAADVPAGTWTLAIDPAPAGSFANPGVKLGEKAPTLAAPGADFLEANRLRALYPATPGPFVALGLNDEKKQYREVWSLVDKRKLGQVRNLEFGSSKAQALSPDGKYLAGKPQWDSEITVFSIGQNKALTPIKLSGASSKLAAFAGKSRLVFEDNKELHVRSVPNLTPVTIIKLGAWKVEDGWAISAGGRFFAAITRKGATAGVTVYDLDSGSVAAEIPLKGEPECQGVAFSPNGQYLAAFLGSDAPQLRVWQVKTGGVASQHDLTAIAQNVTPRESYQGNRLEWLPNNRHLLVSGKVVFDTQDGKSVFDVPSTSLYPIRVVANDQLAVYADGALVNVDLTDVMKAVAAPGPMPSNSVPSEPVADVMPADRSGMAKPELEEVEWAVKPGKPPEPVKARASGVEIPQGQIFLGCLSQSPSGLGYAMYTSELLGIDDNGLPTASPGTKAWLEPLDLKNGDRQKAVPLPSVMLLMSLSTDGIFGCFQNLDGLNKLEIRLTRDGSLKSSIHPYLDAEPGPGQRVSYAEFIDPLTLLTVAGERMTLWDLTTNKAVWEMEIGSLRPELSPARDYVVVSELGGREIYFVETRTGKSAGALPLSQLADDQASAYAFHPNGRFFAVMTRRLDGGDLRIIGLDDGEVKTQFPLPVSASVLQWVGDDYVLLDGSALVSINRECVVWNYVLPLGMHLRDSPDQRHWYIAAEPTRANVYTVRGVDMPDPNVVQRIGAANLRGKTILAPGGAIDIDVQATDPSATGAEAGQEFSTKVKNILTDRYKGATIKVIPGATIKLTVRDRVEGGYRMSMIQDEKPIWSHEIEGADAATKLMELEPPKHAFPAGAERGAGQSTLGVRGAQ